jgi:hypothetical protein
MNAKDPEKLLLKRAKDLLNLRVENLGPRTERRLEDIRVRALSAAEGKRPGLFSPRRWVMAGSFAAATMAVVALFFWLSPSPEPLPATGQVEDLEIITSQERIDFYQNLEFYRWLETTGKGVRTNGNAS